MKKKEGSEYNITENEVSNDIPLVINGSIISKKLMIEMCKKNAIFLATRHWIADNEKQIWKRDSFLNLDKQRNM